MFGKQKCPACNKDGTIEMKEQKLRGVKQITYSFECNSCGYLVQNKISEDELVERIREDKYKIESLTRKKKEDL